MLSEFKKYRRSQIAELRPYIEGEILSPRISVSATDAEAGSPKIGDMIARNPKNHDDQWLVAAKYFADNFEPVIESAALAGQWQPIETAPKDGEEIILRNASWNRVLAHWMPGGHCIEDHPPIDAGWYFWTGKQLSLIHI